MKPASKIDPKAVENTSLRSGLQGRLREFVKDASEDKQALRAARTARFTATGEPSRAPKA